LATDILQGPEVTRQFVDDNGLLTQESRDWVQIINERSVMIGTGSPEGVVEATQGQEYMDDAGTASTIKYIKRDSDDGLGDKTKGWILI